MALTSCGSNKDATTAGESQTTPDRYSQALTEISNTEIPEAVAPDIWKELQAELRSVLEQRRDGTLRSVSEFEPVVDLQMAGGQLVWTQRLVGDYDNNGLVGVGDLTPLGVLYGQAVPGEAEEWNAYRRVDGDGNSYITAADISPLGVHYGESLTGYQVVRAATVDGINTSEVAFVPRVATTDGMLSDTPVYTYQPETTGYYAVIPLGVGQYKAARSAFVSANDGNIDPDPDPDPWETVVPDPFNCPDPQPGDGSITGRLHDQHGNPVDQGVVMVPGVGMVRPNAQGYFSVSGVDSSSSQTVLSSGTGFSTAHDVTFIDGQRDRYMDITVMPTEFTDTINATFGGKLTSPTSGASITLDPFTIVDGAGDYLTDNVLVEITSINVAEINELAAAPGSFNAVMEDGATSLLESYSMVEISMLDSFGNAANLAPGARAMLKYPVPAQIRDYAPLTIGQYIFDNSNDVWRETGTAELNTDRSFYVGPITAAGWWNCDDPLYIRDPAPGSAPTWAYLDVTVVDQHDNPIRGAFVEGLGVDFISVQRGVTDSNGQATIEVNPGSQTRVWAEYDGVYASAQTAVWAPASPGMTKTLQLPVQIENVSTIRASLTWVARPSDLDLRLRLPTGEVCSYAMTDIGGAMLVVDDFDGYGPEVIRVLDLMDGDYELFVVKCQSQVEAPFAKSAAHVIVSGQDINSGNFLIPTSNPHYYDYWHVCMIRVRENGQLITVHEVNRYVQSAP